MHDKIRKIFVGKFINLKKLTSKKFARKKNKEK